MQAKEVPQAVDPNLAAEQSRASNANIDVLQQQTQLDTASLMARYGTKLALSGMSTPSNIVAAAPTVGKI